jgi:hypothetical protein
LARQKARDEARQFVHGYLSQKLCEDCGERDIAVLTFDHVRGHKKMNVSDMISQGYSIESIRTELEKTVVLCFNCHMKREQKRRGTGRFAKSLPNE